MLHTVFGPLTILSFPWMAKDRVMMVTDEQLAGLVQDACQAASIVHHADALPCSTREDCTPPGRHAH